MDIALIAAATLLWVIAGADDLARRRVSLWTLLALTLLALVGQPWPWQLVSAGALLWPWRARAWLLAFPALAVGLCTGQAAPALALSLGAAAWALGWWGGADGIMLLALALRHGLPGLAVGVLAAALFGLGLMLHRRQSMARLLLAWQDLVALRTLQPQALAGSEMPAALALAAGGLVMEGVKLCLIVFG